jgi:hypothetical protein
MLLYLATGAKFMLIIRALAALCLPGCANAASVAFPTPPQRIVSDGTFQVFFEATTLRMHSAASDNTMLTTARWPSVQRGAACEHSPNTTRARS